MGTADQVIAVAMAQRGKKYVFGTAGPNTFDCSGLVVYAYKNGAGISLPHFTGSLWTKGSAVSKTALAPGDLVFPNPSHVGIYIGNGQMVVAPHTGAVVRVEKVGTVWGARRIIAPGTAVGSGPSIVDVGAGLPGQEQAQQIAGMFAAAKQLSDLLKYATDPKTLVRTGIVALGLVFILYGMVRWDATKPIVQGGANVVKNAGKGIVNASTK